MRTHRTRRLAGSLALAGALAALLLTSACSGSSSAASKASGRGSSPAAARAVVSRSRCTANKAAGTMTFVSPFGYDASAGILDVFAAQRLGYFSDLCLKVAFVTNSETPSVLVASGKATITGEGSAADLLALDGSGSLVGIATYGDTSDYALLTRSSITSLRQLVGKTVAYHTTMPVILTEMLERAGVKPSQVDEVNDTSYDPLLLTEGKFDALQAYRSNEPLTLRADHQHFREYIPSSYGISGTFNVQVVNAAFLAAHRGAVSDFLRAELHAFDYCAAHQRACIGYEAADAKAAGASYDVAHNLAEWRFEVALAEDHRLPGRGVGVETTGEWEPEAKAVVRYGLVKSPPDLARVEDTALASSLYSGTTLLWPGS